MNEMHQNIVKSEAPFILLTAKYTIEVQASVTYVFVLACTDSIRLSILPNNMPIWLDLV